MNKYHYPALFEEDESKCINVSFPDLPGCYTYANNLDEAFENAEDALTLHLIGYEDLNNAIPKPNSVKPSTIQTLYVISADTLEYRKKYDNKAVKKTLTIPAWLNKQAEDKGINFSRVLQAALKMELNL